jgi:hypothetical protein
MAEWIGAHLPEGAIVANAVTSVDYLTGRRSVNLHGVTSPAFFGNRTSERDAGTFESWSRLPPEGRPTHLLSSVSTQAGSRLLRELSEGAPLFTTLSLADELQIFRVKGDLLGRQARPQVAALLAAATRRREVDSLNVCDARDEAAHGYAYESQIGDVRLHGTVKFADYPAAASRAEPLRLADGGRAIFGHEAFRIRTEPGRELLVILRTTGSPEAVVMRATGSASHAVEIPESRLEVRADGRPAHSLTFRAGPGWTEVGFELPAAAIRGKETLVELRGRYAAYHYWFYQ